MLEDAAQMPPCGPTAGSPESAQVGGSAPPATQMPQVDQTNISAPLVIPGRLAAVTPLQAVSPSTMVTPDLEKTYLHHPLMPATFVPNEDQRFESCKEAKEFYYHYAGNAGFAVRITKTRKTVKELSCNKQGHWDFYKPGEEKVRKKMSMRCDCKAFVKIKFNDKKGYWFFERIRLEHNHPLNPSPTNTQFLRTQKSRDPMVMGIVDQMHKCDASHNTTVNVLSELYGGRQNFTFTEIDLKNRKAAAAMEEREKKLVEIAMAAVRALRKTSEGFEKGCEQLAALAQWGETIASSTKSSHLPDCTYEEIHAMDETGYGSQARQADEGLGNDTGDGPFAPAAPNEIQILECAPNEARTKGRKRGAKQVVNDDTGPSNSKGKRTCSHCGGSGHYSTGCVKNPENVGKARGGSGSLRGKMGRKRGRPPTKRHVFDDLA